MLSTRYVRLSNLATLSEILQVKRENGFFLIDDHKIPSIRQASPGYGVLLVFQKSQLDKDFEAVLGNDRFAWFPTAEALEEIVKALDFSDVLTRDWLRQGEGWKTGPRPFEGSQNLKVVDFL